MKKILISLITCTSISLMAMDKQKQVIPMDMNQITTPHYPQCEQPQSQSMYISSSQQRNHQANKMNANDCCEHAINKKCCGKAVQCAINTVGCIICGIPVAVSICLSEYCSDKSNSSKPFWANTSMPPEMG